MLIGTTWVTTRRRSVTSWLCWGISPVACRSQSWERHLLLLECQRARSSTTDAALHNYPGHVSPKVSHVIMARLAYGSRACWHVCDPIQRRFLGRVRLACRQSGNRNTASHVITGIVHLSTQYYVDCGVDNPHPSHRTPSHRTSRHLKGGRELFAHWLPDQARARLLVTTFQMPNGL